MRLDIKITVPVFSSPSLAFKAMAKTINPMVKMLPGEITALLARGFKPSGEPQPPNKTSTLLSKVKRGRGAISGVDTKFLSTAKNWRVKRSQMEWTVSAPTNRINAITRLTPKNYSFVGIPKGWGTRFAHAARVAFQKSLTVTEFSKGTR